MSIVEDINEATRALDRVLIATRHRDLRRACPRPCPVKKAQKGKKNGTHVCQLVQGDGMTPVERIRNASPAQMKAQRYDLPGSRGGNTSDPTGQAGEQLAEAGPDGESMLSRHITRAVTLLGQVTRAARRGELDRTTKRTVKQAKDAVHQADLILMRWGPPQPATQEDRKRLAASNTTPPPDCQCCGDPVLMVGSAALETDAGGNLPTKAPTCDWCVCAAKRIGGPPTKRMIRDHKAGRRVKYPDTNHVEAS